MLEYLRSKYGEAFVAEDTSQDQFLPPDFRGDDVLVVHPTSSPDEKFVVAQDQDAPGELKDERVLAKWARTYEEEYGPKITEEFGAGTLFRVQPGSPESWTLTAADLQADPHALFEDAARPSALQFLVAVPVHGSFDVQSYAPAILKAWKLVEAANSGDGFPQLNVYFYDDTQDPSRYLDLRTIPGAVLSWKLMPGVRGLVAAAKGRGLVTESEVVNVFQTPGER